jgi:hypothetical protein
VIEQLSNSFIPSLFIYLYMCDDQRRGVMVYRRGGSRGARQLPSRDEVQVNIFCIITLPLERLNFV